MNNPLLVLATLLLVAELGTSARVARLPVAARAAWRIVALVILTLLLSRIVGSPLHPDLRPEPGPERLWQQGIVVGWWIVAARSLAVGARLLLFVQSRSRETQILSDLIGAGIYAAVALAVIDVVFAVPVGGLIATSGVVAVVIGLALQSTLSDVFSGIAIDLERPYRAGDLIWIEGGVEGMVQEVNWRSTRVVTGHGDIAIVPNSVMAKSRVVNHSMPVPMRSVAVEIRLDPRTAPDRSLAVLRSAVRACLLPLPSPEPTIALTALKGDGAVYEIGFSVTSSGDVAAARTELLSQVQRHLLHAAVPLAVGGIPELPLRPVPTVADLLARSDLFGLLPSDDLEALAAAMTEATFGDGEVLFRQDEEVTALYLIAAGAVGIRRVEADGRERLRRMSPGQCLGIVGMVTGVPFAAHATALTPIRAYRLDKAGLASAMAARPGLAEALEALARRNLAAILQDAAAEDERHAGHPEALLSRMRLFLRRLGTGGVDRVA